LYLEEFFSIDLDVLGFERIFNGDWRFEGDEDEARALSCIFDDTLSPRLTIGNRAQIAVTDGTASRLRSEPSTWSDVVANLPEGTEFAVIGDYFCGNGYRFWQVQ